jgi:hypothetical protein
VPSLLHWDFNLTWWISLPRGCRWNFQHYIFEGC